MAQQSKKTININDERAVRLAKLEALQSAGINPYPARVERTHHINQALQTDHGQEVCIAGRVMIKRDIGKLTFATIKDETGTIQIVLRKEQLDNELYGFFVKKIDAGDILSVKGTRIATKTGEESIEVASWTLLAKSLLPLPDKFHGLQDEETRLRKRYLDYLVNPDQRDKIELRSKIIWLTRQFLQEEGFIEVETPMLETVALGAMAKKFDTYLNAYDLPVHLRIAVGELWQKRLLVGGFEKTFEIGKAFRNEGVSFQHNPEFTMLEYYWAYADYEDNMRLHEKYFPYVLEHAVGSLQITHDGIDLDFTPPYKRISFHDIVLEHTGIDIDLFDTVDDLAKKMKSKGYEADGLTERGKLIDSLYKQGARPKIIQPTFVLNYPLELKPLAKRAEDPRYTEMFQLVVHGFELTNNYTELNDPIDQKERFEEQAKNKAEGDEEAMDNDWDYVEAMEHGMPPATGTGIGMDRLTMLLSDSHSIREVIAFPMVKPEQAAVTAKKSKEAMVAHVVLFDVVKQEAWRSFNAATHLTAALGARKGKQLFQFESSKTKDGVEIPMNIQHAIILKQTDQQNELKDLLVTAQERELDVEVFTKAMQETTNDTKVVEAHSKDSLKTLEILGVLVYGERKKVEAITKKFSLMT